MRLLLTLLLAIVLLIDVDFVCATTVLNDAPATSALRGIHNFTTTKSAKSKTYPEHTQTTRTIERLVGGHLHHPVYRKDDDTGVQQSSRLSKLYFRRKLPTNDDRTSVSTTTSTTKSPALRRRATTTSESPFPTTDRVQIVTPSNHHRSQHDAIDDGDDEALLTDDNRLDVWQNELIAASAGAGPEQLAKPAKDDSKKTLSDQVAEGKYGLIQKEIFSKQPKRPGIISYLPNPEVPNDTADNLGGLDEDDIWLAEDHLLVLKGGHLNTESRNEPWLPIDDYEAPRRPVKLPDNPKVPPPFLVQLEDNGPVQFIGNHKFPLINPFTNESLLLFPEHGGFPKASTFGSDQTNVFARPGASNHSANNNGYHYVAPLPPWHPGSSVNGPNNQTIPPNPFLNGMLPPLMRPPLPFPFHSGSLENSNITDYFDEDDPSLYYPPPYSFTYESNYTNPVPPGPLVPGIVLPPPPNFFSRQNRPSATTSTLPPPPPPPPQPAKPKQYKPIVRPATIRTTSTTTTTLSPRPYTIKLRPTIVTEKPADSRVIARPTTSTSTTSTMRPIITQLRKIVATTSAPPLRSSPPATEMIAFVSKDAVVNIDDTGSNKNNHKTPIYYEYFDIRPGQKANSASSAPRIKPASQPTINLSSSSKQKISTSTTVPTTKLHKHTQQRPFNAYLPLEPFDYDKYVYITPKPEITPNGIANNHVVHIDDIDKPQPIRKARPIQEFNQEVDAIRQTLQFYKTTSQPYAVNPIMQQQQPPQRIPKAKAVYEYSYEATQPPAPKFSPPQSYDTTPFKPMVQYSAPMNDADNDDDNFKGIPAYSTTTEQPQDGYYSTMRSNVYPVLSQQTVQANRANSARNYIPKKPATQAGPAYIPTYDNQQYYYNTVPQKSNQQPYENYNSKYYQSPEYTTVRSALSQQQQSQQPWVSIEKQNFRQVYPKEINVQIQGDSYAGYPSYQRNTGSYNSPPNYYYKPSTERSVEYGQQPPHAVQPKQQPNIYLNQIEQIRQHINRYPSQQQQQQLLPISLINDTAINYNGNSHSLPINPDSEYVQPYISTHQNRPQYSQHQTQQQQQQQKQRYPLPPPQRLPLPNPNRFYPPSNTQQQSSIPLAKDILVNYKYPLPPTNGDSEYLPQDRYNAGGRRYYNQPPPSSGGDTNSAAAAAGVVQYKLPGDQQAGVYIYTPQYQNN